MKNIGIYLNIILNFSGSDQKRACKLEITLCHTEERISVRNWHDSIVGSRVMNREIERVIISYN
jgi:hypothetical protein